MRIWVKFLWGCINTPIQGIHTWKGQLNNVLVQVSAIGFKLSKNEVGHINESLKTKAIPTPKLLIKDHKKMSIMGKFPTRLVIPATNFSATFAKIGYLGVKNILEMR